MAGVGQRAKSAQYTAAATTPSVSPERASRSQALSVTDERAALDAGRGDLTGSSALPYCPSPMRKAAAVDRDGKEGREARATVFVVDDDESFRESMHFLLEPLGHAVETFSAAKDFLASYEPGQCGCLIVDMRMPQMSGLQLQEELNRRGVDLPVIVVTGHADVDTAVRSMQLGATDYVRKLMISKPVRASEFLPKVQAAVELHQQRRRRAAKRESLRARISALTGRELDVFQRIVRGDANKVIAAELAISEKTVEIHRSRVMMKMRARSFAELVRMATFAGLGR